MKTALIDTIKSNSSKKARNPMADNCTNCLFYDYIDDFTFYCDQFGVCSSDDMRPCEHHIPFDEKESEDNNAEK